MTVRKYRSRAQVEAMQWDGTATCDDELFDWAIDVWSQHEDGRPKAIRQLFLSFRPENDFTEMEHPAERIAAWKAEGFSAVVFDNSTGRWAGVRTGDWIVEVEPETFRPMSADEFAATYQHEESAKESETEIADTIAREFGIQGLTIENGTSTLTTRPTTERARQLVLAMSLACGRMLDDDQAPNYVEFEVSPAGHPGYIVHVRRAVGPSPHTLRRAAEARIAELEAAQANNGPRIITNATELDTLPVGAVILAGTDDPKVLEKAERLDHPFTRDGARSVWWEIGLTRETTTFEIELPATVLFVPEEVDNA